MDSGMQETLKQTDYQLFLLEESGYVEDFFYIV